MAETQHTEVSAPTKKCTGCGRNLPATRELFHRHPSGKFGLQSACRECQAARKRIRYQTAEGKEAAKTYRDKNRDAITAYNRLRPPISAAKREDGRRRAIRWYYENRDRARADRALYRARRIRSDSA